MIPDSSPRSAFLTGAAGALPSRTVAVLEAIKHAILAGELKPGGPLVETDLAAVLGVSKTPVREALKTLAGAGLVTMHPYKGAVVRHLRRRAGPAHLRPARAARARGARPRGNRAGTTGTKAHDALDRADACAGQAERSLANRDFHHELYAGCGNPLLVRMLDDLRDQTALVSVAAWRHDPATFPPRVPRAGSARPPSTAASCTPPRPATPAAPRACSTDTSPPSSSATSLPHQQNHTSRVGLGEERNGEPRMSLTPAAAASCAAPSPRRSSSPSRRTRPTGTPTGTPTPR